MIPIPGTKRRKYLEENVGGLVVKLSSEQISALAAIFPPDVAAGEGYAASMMGALNC